MAQVTVQVGYIKLNCERLLFVSWCDGNNYSGVVELVFDERDETNIGALKLLSERRCKHSLVVEFSDDGGPDHKFVAHGCEVGWVDFPETVKFSWRPETTDTTVPSLTHWTSSL